MSLKDLKIRCINCGFQKSYCFMCWDCWRPTLISAAVSAVIGGLVTHFFGVIWK